MNVNLFGFSNIFLYTACFLNVIGIIFMKTFVPIGFLFFTYFLMCIIENDLTSNMKKQSQTNEEENK